MTKECAIIRLLEWWMKCLYQFRRIRFPAIRDRKGLPGWAYSNDELFALEQDLIFRAHWQLACHLSDLAEPGAYVTFDMGYERALILRDKAGTMLVPFTTFAATVAAVWLTMREASANRR